MRQHFPARAPQRRREQEGPPDRRTKEREAIGEIGCAHVHQNVDRDGRNEDEGHHADRCPVDPRVDAGIGRDGREALLRYRCRNRKDDECHTGGNVGVQDFRR